VDGAARVCTVGDHAERAAGGQFLQTEEDDTRTHRVAQQRHRPPRVRAAQQHVRLVPYTQRQREAHARTHTYTHTHTDIHAHTDRHTDRQTHRHTDAHRFSRHATWAGLQGCGVTEQNSPGAVRGVRRRGGRGPSRRPTHCQWRWPAALECPALRLRWPRQPRPARSQQGPGPSSGRVLVRSPCAARRTPAPAAPPSPTARRTGRRGRPGTATGAHCHSAYPHAKQGQ
jgi:hypothetical protein